MILRSTGVTDGVWDLSFGKFGTQKIDGVPRRSMPLTWAELPEGTQSIVLIMQDYDAIPVCGFSWIHWTVADIDPALGGLEENASREDDTLVQGMNSLASKQVCGEQQDMVTSYYGGPRPPDTDHEYEITAYALDTVLGLQKGFRMNELMRAMRGHVLESSSLYAMYPAHE